MNLNQAILIGRATRDPELKMTPSGTSVVNFSIATNETYTDKAGAKQEKTQFHNCVAFGRQAEIIGQYVRKGQEVCVVGSIETRAWTDKTGAERKTTEIMVKNIQLGSQPGPRPAAEPQPIPEPHHDDVPVISLDDPWDKKNEIKPEDIPF